MSDSPAPTKRKRVNVRRPDVMTLVQAEVEKHYYSPIVEKLRDRGGSFTIGKTTIRLAEQFGFCYGVERAIDLAYAARRVFPDQRIFLIGEIIHNQEVNQKLTEMNIVSLPWKEITEEYDQLESEDVVIVPAFGAPTDFTEKIEQQGCHIIDTTCGDVMKVWRRVRTYAKTGVTSLIHGKRGHEETRATASRAIGEDKKGHYLIVLTLAETEIVTDYIKNGGDKAEFLAHFEKAHSDGFDPDVHLKEVGVANQTTMLKSETEEIQRRVRTAISERDGGAIDNFQVFDTICGATQERQDALFDMLKKPMNVLLVVGGYNSSNTAHLVEIGNENLPTYFIREASCLESLEKIVHFDLEEDEEITSKNVLAGFDDSEATIGITAGASCPANLIEETIVRVLNLRGIERETVEAL
ncbi:4-hydroxy-3-methylbut-2-enyl diphosphate reductase [bacterium]|nr:4-hydroxy-3-methylbut-2-enyl diphosphate reductase [Akkermansiaceae bacterium]MDA7514521.1 4-hydroxy-3-methylbut-2-enyl diphosphate reductase [bacterium]MDB0055880.1 4-hydroxy-3-methylbut-2-enyl diphosphate reductase [Akkermansiaceae bacterium]MDB4258181.1 4-hydroxy-3-methylbut-2-enyl diphosphate reductase [Akkermansiaceae bacterium]MDB4261808.1 4-hydroxy-3-methylbut-2-enyl diphosphate reductase [Akkermansiaceae bacterium]